MLKRTGMAKARRASSERRRAIEGRKLPATTFARFSSAIV